MIRLEFTLQRAQKKLILTPNKLKLELQHARALRGWKIITGKGGCYAPTCPAVNYGC